MKRKSIAFLPLTISLIASASAQSLQDGLVVYYDFEETGPAGLANKAPNATDHNGIYLGDISSIPGAGAGFAGSAAYPGASSTNTTDRSQLLAGNALNIAKANNAATAGKGQFQVPTLTSRGSGADDGGTLGTEFTISAWFLVARDADNTSTNGDIIRNTVFEAALDGATNTQVYDVSWATSGNNSNYVPYLNATAGTASTLTDNQWHHVLHTVTSDGTTSTLNSYVNGSLSATITAPTNTVDFRGINFGAHRGGGRILDGMIDEVAVWNRSMEADEVTHVYSLGLSGLPLIEPDDSPRLFWDTNGLTAGSGGPAPSGDWNAANWTTDPLGETTTANWQDGQIAEFAAGADASGSYTVALNGSRQASEVRVRAGQLTLQGGTLQLTGSAALRALPGASLTLATGLDAPALTALTARGDITLQNAASLAGPLSVAAGTLRLENDFSFGGLSGNGTLNLPTANLTLLPPAGSSFSFSGPMAGDGTLLLAGPGTQTLTRANDAFTGGFTVENGTLVLNGTKNHLGTTQVNGGLLVTDGTLAGPLQVAAAGSLSLGSTPVGNSRTTLRLEADNNTILGNLTLDFNATNDTPGLGNNDLLDVAANLTFGPASTVTPRFINGIPAPGASYEFAWINGSRSGTPTIDPAFQARTRYQFAIQPGEFSPEDLQIAVIGGEPEFLVWTGDGTTNRWEVAGAPHWSAAGSPSAFLIPDNVDFTDSGNNALPIEIIGEVMPSSIIVDANEKDYTWAGSGTVTGGAGLDKYGTARLTLLNQNSFSGPVRIFGGHVDVGDGTTTGTLGGSGDIQISDGASLRFLRSDTLTLGRRITGGGELIQAGSGTLRLGQAGSNGNITIDSGTFQALDGGWANSYFSTANRQIVVNGGTLVTSTHTLGGLGGTFHRPDITLHTGATWQLNAEQYMNAGDLILHGGTILVTAVNLRLQGGTMVVGESAGGSLITRSGSGVVTLFATPTFQVADGSAAVDFEISAPIGQDGTRGIIKSGPGVMRLSANNSFTGGVTVSEGSLQLGAGGETGSAGSGAIINNAALEINRSDALALANTISGSGTLAIKGGGTVTLTGTNTYTGNTSVEDGTLVLGTTGQLAFTLTGTSSNSVGGSGSAEFNGSFQIDLSGADFTDGNTWTLAATAGQSFGGTFALTSTAGAFSKSGTLHTLVADGRTWSFNETTGTLTVSDGIILANGASLKMLNGTEAGTGSLTVNGGNLWFGEAVNASNDILLVGPPAQNVFGGTMPVDYLIVGGGGGGGARDSSGGGGGGAVLSNLLTPGFDPLIVAPVETIPVAVGDGGAGGVGPDGSGTTRGQQGQSSQLGTVVAPGGGGGGGYASTGGTGASGGGGGRNSAGGIGTAGLGFNGGAGAGGTTTSHPGGGGGGAGQAGQQGVLNSKGGDGGNGLAVPMIPLALATDLNIGEISGSNVYFGGGGGGTGHRSPTTLAAGIGGLGGGGTGADRFTAPPAVAPNTGGGGGAARSDNANAAISSGAKGGSGVVIARYPGSAKATGGTDIRTVDGFTYHTFTTTGAGTLGFDSFTGTSSATLTGTLSGSGGFTWNSSGTLTLANPASYSGDTAVQAGTLALPHASLADGSSVFLSEGATLHLAHGQTDTVNALWINGVQQAAGTYHAANSNGAITGTGSLLVTSGPDSPTGFQGWIAGFFPGETNPAITGPNADPNGDGVANALVYLFGGDPKNGNNRALLPTATLATNPGGGVPAGNYLVVTYRRDSAASVSATVEYGTTLTGPWSTATAGSEGVFILETPDAFAPGIHKVEVFLPRSPGRLFARVAASTTP